MTKKFLSLLLCAALVLSLTACGDSETTPPTTLPPTTAPTTEPAPDPGEVYAEAAAAVEEMDSMLLGFSVEKEMTIGSDVFVESQETSLSLKDLGTDAFLAGSSTELNWGEDYYTIVSDTYTGGTLYGAVASYAYSTPMTAEEYVSRFAPAILLTPSLYSTVEFLSDSVISFSGASELEPWLAEDALTLVNASGTATIGGNGALTDCTYDATYIQGGIEIHLVVSSRIVPATAQVDLPEDTSIFAPTENPDAALSYERALGLILQAKDITSYAQWVTLIEAGAVTLTEQCTMNTYGSGREMLAQFDTELALLDLSTASPAYTYSSQEIFRDGIFTISEDGGAAQANRSVNAETVESYRQGLAANEIPLLSDLENLTMTDLGPAYLVEFTYFEDVASQFTTTLVGSVYEDPNLLNDLASDYRTEKAEGFLGIDKATGLPTALGITYTGIHTIEGTECMLSYDVSQTYSVGTGASYETITGEQLPLEKPEALAEPLLYHVTGSNGEEMWLFGTIHVGDERTAYLPQELQDAFAASDALAVEFDTDAFTEQLESDPDLASVIAECYYHTDGTSTVDHIEDEVLYESAVRMLKATGGYNSTARILRPVFLSQIIENAYLDMARTLSGGYGADSQLLKMAREQEKRILNVESGEFQCRMLADYSDELQEYLLKETMELDASEYQHDVVELYELWCLGDEAALREYILTDEAELEELTEEERRLYDEYNAALSTDRNATMLEVAQGYLSSGETVFYAVGLAHLLAEDGLVNTLRAAGYTVELISYE